MDELETEVQAAEFVKRILIDDVPAPTVSQLRFGDWADFEIKLHSKNLIIPTSAMRSALAAQDTFYRGAALMTDGKPNINNLSVFEKEILELEFRVMEGSTILSAAVDKLTDGLATAMGNMTGKQLTASAIVLILTVGGAHAYRTYADNQIEKQKLTAETEQQEQLFSYLREERENDMRVINAINQASSNSMLISQIDSMKEENARNVIRGLSNNPKSEIAGMILTPDLVGDINKTPRESSTERTIVGEYAIARVDTTSAKGFRVRVTDTTTGESFTAGLEDAMISAETRVAIESATFNKTPINAAIKVKMMRGSIVDATIVSAAR